MIQQLLIYCISISILVIVLIFINRVIYYKKHIEETKKPKPTVKMLHLSNRINNNVHPEKKFFWANNEKIN